MAVIVVSRFKGNQDFVPLLKEAAAVLKKHGATSVRGGRCHAGEYAGQIVVATTLGDWTAYGRLMQSLTADADWQRLQAEATKNFELQDRSLIVAEDF
jgi:hypothetical protein